MRTGDVDSPFLGGGLQCQIYYCRRHQRRGAFVLEAKDAVEFIVMLGVASNC